MDLTKKFERIQHDLTVIEIDFLHDLHQLLKINFPPSKELDSRNQDKINLFMNKDYNFSKYSDFLAELVKGVQDLEGKSRKLPELTETLKETKKKYEDKKASLTNTNYELSLIRENSLVEVNSLKRELQMSKNLIEEFDRKIDEEDNRQKRKEAEINKTLLEIQNIKHRSTAHSNLLKKSAIERESQVLRLKEKLRDLDNESDKTQRDFEEKMDSKEAIIKDLNRKIILVEKEIELLKDMESLRLSKN